jgi:hypothetical protein
MKPTIFQRGVDSIKLRDELMLTPVGSIITYARLSEVLGKPVSGTTSALSSARRIVEHEDKILFGCVRGQGLKRLDSEGVVDQASTKTQAVRRRARRVVKTLTLAVFEDLKEASQRKAVAVASVLFVIADLAKEKSINAVELKAYGRSDQLPVIETLKALGFISKSEDKK